MRLSSASVLAPIVAFATLWFSPLVSAELITIVEFYNTNLKHFVLITDPDEVAAIEAGAAGPGWERTGGSLMAYSKQDDAQLLVPVCRFYGNVAQGGPNSHFFTADPAECAAVKTDPGWHFEGIAFYVQLTAAPAAASILKSTIAQRTVYRAYNRGFQPGQMNNGNHRFSTSRSAIDSLVAQGWADEGPVFVVPGSTEPGAALSGSCLIPRPGFEGIYSTGTALTQTAETTGTPAAPTVHITGTQGPIRYISRTSYSVSAQQNGRQMLSWDLTHNEITGPGVLISEDISIPQSLLLPMRPGEVQLSLGSVFGSHQITATGVNCSSPVTGSYSNSYQFLGLMTQTFPVGSYGVCVFRYKQDVKARIECGDGWALGKATDNTILFFNEAIGLMGSVGGNGSLELINIVRLPPP